MSKLIVLQGIPASGKSTWARQWVEKDPSNRIVVNRDSIRRMLGIYWVPSREDLVTDIEDFSVECALLKKYDVCIDATNLNKKSINRWIKVAEDCNSEIEFKKFDISLEDALERDKNRGFPVGEKVIKDFYNRYEQNSDLEQ